MNAYLQVSSQYLLPLSLSLFVVSTLSFGRSTRSFISGSVAKMGKGVGTLSARTLECACVYLRVCACVLNYFCSHASPSFTCTLILSFHTTFPLLFITFSRKSSRNCSVGIKRKVGYVSFRCMMWINIMDSEGPIVQYIFKPFRSY